MRRPAGFLVTSLACGHCAICRAVSIIQYFLASHVRSGFLPRIRAEFRQLNENFNFGSTTQHAGVQRFQCDSRSTVVVFQNRSNHFGVTRKVPLTRGNHNAAPCVVIHQTPQRSKGHVFVHLVVFNEAILIGFDQKIRAESGTMDF